MLFAGQALSFFGAMLTYVAIPYQVYHLTGSSLAVGLLSLAALVPLLITAFIGGAFADAVDRRRMLQLAELALGLATAILFLNSLLDEPKVWVLFVVTPLMAAIDGFQRPALDSMVPRLVTRDELTAASALDSLRGEFGMIAGPAVGGVLIATIGLPATYGIDIATYGASVFALALMRAVPPPPDAVPPSVRSIVEGMKYALEQAGAPGELRRRHGRDVLRDADGALPGNRDAVRRGRGARAPLRGAIGGRARRVADERVGGARPPPRHGDHLGGRVLGRSRSRSSGSSPNLLVALFFLALAGAADMISGIFRGTLWNQTIPDRLRGRLAGIEQVSYSSGPLLGNLESGIVAALFGVRTSVVSGGVLCVAGVGIFALLLPAFRHYDARRATTDNPP